MPFLKDRSFSSRITGGRAARPAGGTRVVGTAKSRIGVGPSLFGSRGYTTRPKLDIWLKKQSRKQRDFGKI
ncbi:MAG: hypothetical protein Q7K28_01490 [Candidatus Wildermuthbacteria bacterium]|nr:hypothetical protein [Candidatus Wildermuthbacteria bacterium]